MPVIQRGSFCSLFTHSSYLSENLGTGFGLLCQMLIAVSVYLADVVMVSWQNQRGQHGTVCAAPQQCCKRHFHAVCR